MMYEIIAIPVPPRKSPTHSSRSLLGVISAAYQAQIMVVDLVGLFPENDSGNCYIMVIGDYFPLDGRLPHTKSGGINSS